MLYVSFHTLYFAFLLVYSPVTEDFQILHNMVIELPIYFVNDPAFGEVLVHTDQSFQ